MHEEIKTNKSLHDYLSGNEIMLKPTSKNMGAFYGFSEQTMSKYRNGTPEKQRLFEAMKAYFVKVHGN